MKNTRSRVAVLAAAIGAAAMILAPAAQAETSQLVATSAADALADAKAGVVKLEAFESVDRAMAAPRQDPQLPLRHHPWTSFEDGDLFLVGSSKSDPTTWVRSRLTALRSSAWQGAGATETFTYTPTVSDTYGVVVINEAAGGKYTLTRNN